MIKQSLYKILDNRIEFQFYNLLFSSLHKNNVVTPDRINAIDLNTSPHSLIIDNREVIFLNHHDKISLAGFASKNKIPFSTCIDTWSILTRDYLDTQISGKTIDEQNKQLLEIGIDQNAFDRISKNLRYTLFGTTEWTYLGLWDVLALKQYRDPFYRFCGEIYYWKAMALALKGTGYQTNKVELF